MRTSTLIAALTASLVAADQSAPFNLVLKSSNSTIDGVALASCHEGAAIEGLCLTTTWTPTLAAATYNLNYSACSTDGLLTWNLPFNTNQVLSEPMTLQGTRDANVEAAFFNPSSSGTTVGFDENNLLYIPDATGVPTYSWYACTIVTSYTYDLVSWVTGTDAPLNPTCVKTSVERVFI